MPRWILLVVGALGVTAVLGHVLVGPLLGRTAPEGEHPPAAAAPITPVVDPVPDGGPGSSVAGQRADPLDSDDRDSDGADELWTDDWPEIPDAAPAWWLPPLQPMAPEDFAAIHTAELATSAFARPTPANDDDWWPGMRAFMSSQGAADYESVDPQEVGYTTVTGPGRLVRILGHTPLAGVDVPTDSGPYRIILEPDDRRPTGWAVTSIRPAEGYR